MGLVWCVSVPTGAFVARRNGKVFVTGNSGFPKSQNIGLAIDKAAGAVREVTGLNAKAAARRNKIGTNDTQCPKSNPDSVGIITAPATELAQLWDGYGTALKPAWECAVLARKPLIGTMAENVAAFGVGGLAIDACRIEGESTRRTNIAEMGYHGGNLAASYQTGSDLGRWPANLLLDEEAGAALDAQSGDRPGMSGGGTGARDLSMFGVGGVTKAETVRGDSGGASRFFYCSKASARERELGTDALPYRSPAEMTGSQPDAARLDSPRTGAGRTGGARNGHPTVKPVDLMRYLARLIMPPAPGKILVPFAGSGSEMIGALLAGWPDVTGIERDAEYVAIARARVALAVSNPRAFEAEYERAAKPDARQTGLFGRTGT